MTMDDETVIAALDQAGIDRTLITGFDEFSSVHETFIPNELVAGLAERHPDRFIPFAGADVLAGMDAVRDFEHLVRDRGFRGLSVRPFMIGVPADDRRYYPLYAKCVELDVPVSIHSSANWTTVAVSDLGHPRHIDVVAADFPELKIVMSHAGYPWVLESALLAWKYPNVYLELAAHRPSYLATPGTGWEPLLRYGTTTIRDKVLFGTGWFLLGRPPGRSSRSSVRCRCRRTCSRCGCGATRRRCWARGWPLEEARLLGLGRCSFLGGSHDPPAGAGGGRRAAARAPLAPRGPDAVDHLGDALPLGGRGRRSGRCRAPRSAASGRAGAPASIRRRPPSRPAAGGAASRAR